MAANIAAIVEEACKSDRNKYNRSMQNTEDFKANMSFDKNIFEDV